MSVYLFTLSLISFLGYFATNNRKFNYVFRTKLDSYIPLLPIFVVPYIFLFPYIIFTYIYLLNTVWINDFLAAITLANISATVFWYIFPNGVVRQTLKAQNIFTKAINYIYKKDGDTNGFPSAHVYLSYLCTGFLILAAPTLWTIFFSIFILIGLSTLLIKQHYFVDILGGILFGLGALLITLW